MPDISEAEYYGVEFVTSMYSIVRSKQDVVL